MITKPQPTIVLAEDDKFLSTAMGDKLAREGFRVVRALNGEEAVSQIKAEKPDLVLLDLIMPKKTGFEVLAEVKADPQTRDIPIIILSNLGQESDIDKARALGAADYFVKSNVDMKEVVVRVKEWLDGQPFHA
ncbi:MAG: response regulator [Patescibacteria group bacterium]